MTTVRQLPLPDEARDQGFAERCAMNRARFDPGNNGRVDGQHVVHAMRLTPIMDELEHVYLPACHTGVYGFDPLRYLAEGGGVTCRGCLALPVVGRAAPAAPVHVRGRFYRDIHQLQLDVAGIDEPARHVPRSV